MEGLQAEQRHELARMVGAAVGGVVAVVGGDDQQVVVAHGVHDAAEAPVEVLERQSVAERVAAVSVHGVEIDQVGEAQAVPIARHDLIHMVHAIGVALVVIALGKTVAAQQVVGLAHGDGVESRVAQEV